MQIQRLPYTIADGELVPAWLGDRDRPWLRDLLDAAAAYVGRPIAELLARLRRSDVDPRAGMRQAPAVHTLTTWLRRAASGPARSATRQQLFQLHAGGLARDAALQQLAREQGLDADELAASLFADLPDRRLVHWPDPPPDAGRLALATNTDMVQSMLRHAHTIELQLLGASRALLRTAWLHGAHLQTIAHDDGSATGCWRRETSTGTAHAFAAIVPLLPWARRYRCTAQCRLGRDRGRVVLQTGDPILPGPEPRRYDSQLERHFALDFLRARPDWRLLREPAPLATAHGLAFPDFALTAPDGARTWLCEVAGLRAASAMPAKLALLAHAQLVLCLPERAMPVDYRKHPRVVPFRRRVAIERVLTILDRP
jgi:predicted nuclease of restriction endonuclease-like RecB superfamily